MTLSTSNFMELRSNQRNKIALPIPPKVFEKYNNEMVTQIYFTSLGLELLKKKYRHVRGLPPFLHHTMKGRPTDVSHLVLSNHKLCTWTDDYSFLIIPNYCTDYASILKNPLTIKDSDFGLGLVAWWIAPELLKTYGFKKNEIFEKKDDTAFANFLQAKSKLRLTYPGYQSFKRSDSQKEISEIENKYPDCHYIATILDLTPAHLPQLENLKKTSLAYIQKIYGINLESDLVEMYFHFPYAENTTTLHLHIRINFGRHPMEISRSFYLDEIIACLKEGKSIKELILKRRSYFSDDFDILHNIPGIRLEQSKNPYILPSPYFNQHRLFYRPKNGSNKPESLKEINKVSSPSTPCLSSCTIL